MVFFNRTKLKNSEEITKEQKKENIKLTATKPVSNQLAFLLKQAWVTEKSGNLSPIGKYVFLVDKNANKPQIKKAVEAIYKVNVENVNVLNRKSKSRRLGRNIGAISGYKKAIVSLKKGHKIDI